MIEPQHYNKFSNILKKLKNLDVLTKKKRVLVRERKDGRKCIRDRVCKIIALY